MCDKTLLYGSFLESHDIPRIYDSPSQAKHCLLWWILPFPSSFCLDHGEILGGLYVFCIEAPLLDLSFVLLFSEGRRFVSNIPL